MDETDRTTEREWIERCQRGDKEAYGFLVKRYMQQAYFVALGLVGDHDDALDLSQEAFVRAYRAIESFDPQLRFYTWYYTILKNLCFNFLRDRRTRPAAFSTIVENEAMMQHSANDPSADLRLMQEETRRQV